MPIILRLPFVLYPRWRLNIQIRLELPPPLPFLAGREADYDLTVRELSRRLPPHLVRDVVNDGE